MLQFTLFLRNFRNLALGCVPLAGPRSHPCSNPGYLWLGICSAEMKTCP